MVLQVDTVITKTKQRLDVRYNYSWTNRDFLCHRLRLRLSKFLQFLAQKKTLGYPGDLKIKVGDQEVIDTFIFDMYIYFYLMEDIFIGLQNILIYLWQILSCCF